jgi:hypothetical protein
MRALTVAVAVLLSLAAVAGTVAGNVDNCAERGDVGCGAESLWQPRASVSNSAVRGLHPLSVVTIVRSLERPPLQPVAPAWFALVSPSATPPPMLHSVLRI